MSDGNEGAGGAPIPWVGGAIALACLVVSVHAWTSQGRVEAELDTLLGAAEAYLLERPYLEAHPLLEHRITADALARKRSAWEASRNDRGAPPTPRGVVRREQESLDEKVAAAVAGLGALPADRIGFVPARRTALSHLTYAFLHSGRWHLIGNLCLLLLVGLYLERAFGLPVVGVGFVASALGGAVALGLASPELERPLVGVSPALAGLLAAFALCHWRDRADAFYVTAMVSGVSWLGLPPWAGAAWSFAGASSFAAPVDPKLVYWAYLGGAGGGVLWYGVVRLAGLDVRMRERGEVASKLAADPLFEEAMRARVAGDGEQAMAKLRTLLRRDPDALDAALTLWDLASDLGRRADASAAMVQVVRIELKRGLAEAAVDHWVELTHGGFPEAADPALLVRMALVLQKADKPEAAISALRCALERSRGASEAVVAARVARAARDLDPATAQDAAWRALGSMELALEERQALESLLAEVIPRTTAAAPRPRIGPAGRERIDVPAPADEPGPPAASTGQDTPAARQQPIAIEIDERLAEIIDAVPVEIDGDGVYIVTLAGDRKRVRFERVEAVAVAAVHGMGPKPVLVVDLVLNWMSTTKETLRVIRLRGDRFDPRRLVPKSDSAVDALRRFVARVLRNASATPLPDENAAAGQPFAAFDDIDTYHTAVLMVDRVSDGTQPKD